MTPFGRRVLRFCESKLGCPYIWGGHGALVWTPTVPRPTLEVAGCDEGYDCAGLVTCAVLDAGGPDLRWAWNAQTMWNRLPPVDNRDEDWDEPTLLLYGSSPSHVTHVAIDLGRCVIQSAGGDQTTTTLAAAKARPAARVQLSPHERRDRLGYRSLAAMEYAKP